VSHKNINVIIAGGGFFGCSIALMLKRRGMRPLVVEAQDELLTRASQVNQARVHGGYHYPRSLITAYRSRYNYERFRRVYREAIVDQFTKVYGVSRLFSKVTANQFEVFMQRIGAPLKAAPDKISRLFDANLTESVWIAEECAFDCSLLRQRCRRDLEEAGIPVRFGTRVLSAQRDHNGTVVAGLSDGSEWPVELVINATYSGLNLLTQGSALPVIPLKHELAEMALIRLPEELDGLSVTMMCGPFFSFMPYPSRELTTLSHVRYTPHLQWFEKPGVLTSDPYQRFSQLVKQTHYEYMVTDASRYIPSLRKAAYVDSIWEVKTLLPQTEVDDGRPILFRRDPAMPEVIHVMGGKIDNIFDVEDELDIVLSTSPANIALAKK
jgi:glycine/D-amino acid oxidase-like deaminating enzyme